MNNSYGNNNTSTLAKTNTAHNVKSSAKKREKKNATISGTIIAVLSLIIAAIAFYWGHLSPDFSLSYDDTANKYILYKSGTDIKNAEAEMYYFVEFPTEKSRKTYHYIRKTITSGFDIKNNTFEFPIKDTFRERCFCESMSYMFYDTSNPYFYPIIKTYVKVRFEFTHIPYLKFNKWYELQGSETKRLYLVSKIKKDIKYNNNNKMSLEKYYNSIHINLCDTIENCNISDFETVKSLGKLLPWISKRQAKPLSSAREAELRQLYLDAINGQ